LLICYPDYWRRALELPAARNAGRILAGAWPCSRCVIQFSFRVSIREASMRAYRWILENPRKLEAMGLGLILLAAGWQIFMDDALKGEIEAGRYFGIREWLLQIWEALGSSDVKGYVNSHYTHYYDTLQVIETSAWPVKLFRAIRFSLFGLGSCMVIFSKWIS
jgi:hypothetical protein